MIIVRPVSLDDADVLLEWRNDPATRAASLSTQPVDRDAHVEWLMRAIADPRRTLYIGELEGTAIGTIRFDAESDTDVEVSLTVAPRQRGKRLAGPLLKAGLALFSGDAAQNQRITARIREENAASRALFTSAGFVELGSADGVLTYALPPREVRTEAPS
ncbi:GNAT family N-acetyltransferase [Microbacterium hydrocarbonoxydans]|uniref:Protein N-acetyltransferase, RimJ/RimL family n=1 Tax=Microbacterium hydrocarbonoxydans TaxID=273678 RepID=A0A1H4NM89_9MICO|nr:GNAT family N-acetyltransferase [Microbacterium hydrocarbonoxydans]SEB96329.1 Protein N-acetyltransferase, RimJ/RimL family [Microbacterium hydrocarbonoxydans]